MATMKNVLKLAGASAVLAAVFVIAMEASKAESLGAGRTAEVRAARTTEGASLSPEPAATVTRASADGGSGDCRAQTWPYVDRGCIAAAGEPGRKPVRTIAIERREAPGTPDPVPVPFHPGR